MLTVEPSRHYCRFHGIDLTSTVRLQREDVTGKAMLCKNVLSEWLPEWMMSKED